MFGLSPSLLGSVAAEASTTTFPTTANEQAAKIASDTTNTSDATTTSTPTNPLTIMTKRLPTAVASQFYSATLKADGGEPPYTWSMSGQPGWLSLNTSTGVISGRPPSSAAAVQVTFEVTDSGNPPQTAGSPLGLKVESSPPPPSTSPPTSTTIPGPPFTNSACGTALNQQIQRKLAYQPSQRMHVDRPTTVIVVLGTASRPPVTITAPGTTVVVPIETTCEVEAQLTAAPGTFAISPTGYQPMSFLDSPVVSWTWQVTPEEAGRDLQLQFDINSLYQVSGDQPIPGSVRSYTAVINVSASPTSFVKHASNVFDNPLFLTLLGATIPLALAAVGAYLHRRRKVVRMADGATLGDETDLPTLHVSVRGSTNPGVTVDLPVGFDQVIGRQQDAGISHHHAHVFRDGSGVWLEDLGSTNGIFVNGQRIEGQRRLQDGDGVAFGDVEAVFHDVGV